MNFDDKQLETEESKDVSTENNTDDNCFFDDDEASALTDMVKAIAVGGKADRQLKKASYAKGTSSETFEDDDEDEWTFKKPVVRSEKPAKPERKAVEKPKKAADPNKKSLLDELRGKLAKKKEEAPASSCYAPLPKDEPVIDDWFNGTKDLTEIIDEVYSTKPVKKEDKVEALKEQKPQTNAASQIKTETEKPAEKPVEKTAVERTKTSVEPVKAEENDPVPETKQPIKTEQNIEPIAETKEDIKEEPRLKVLSLENEMRMAVEDIMCMGESEAEKNARHESYYDDDDEEIPVIDMSDIGFFDENFDSDIAASDDIINELGLQLAEQVSDELDSGKRKIVRYSVLGFVAAFVLFILFVLFTRPGHVIATKAIAHIVMSKVQTVDAGTNVRLNEEDVLNNDQRGDFIKYTPSVTPQIAFGENTPTPTVYVDYHPHFDPDPSVINILLIGIEDQYNDQAYGRSDSMIVASFDKDGGPVKLVSLMRDMFVEIPGYNDNRLNAAFAFGGPKLLMETIELNFGLVCDGYVMVDFASFETIVDYIGGIEVSLTADEAEYLCKTNYISNKEQRNVVAGSQLMTGSQVLGYCRVRYVATANGLNQDFGRTYRQRVVLQKIFDKYKSAGVQTLYGAMTECLKYVKCSPDIEPLLAEALQTFVEKQINSIETYRIPVSGHYDNTKINGQAVLAIDSYNADILHEYLYEE